MKPVVLLAATLPFFSVAHAADCALAKAEEVLSLPFLEKADREVDVTEQQSVEGGTWTIYNSDGKPQRLIRTDYGETGRTEHVLAMADANAYIIRKTYFLYAAPIYESGSAVVREETDYYRFCDGKLDLPENWETDEAYLKAAKDAGAQFFSAPEITADVTSAGLKPPLWK